MLVNFETRVSLKNLEKLLPKKKIFLSPEKISYFLEALTKFFICFWGPRLSK